MFMDINFLLTLFGIIVIIAFIFKFRSSNVKEKTSTKAQFLYERTEQLMTPSENEFFRTLNEVAGDRYYIFPQIHLSSLFTNKTYGRYYKLGFQRINRMSVDYVLCDKTTLKPIYAIELDDPSHNKPARQSRDAAVEQIFEDMDMPLIRFTDYQNLTKDQIIERFVEAAHNDMSQIKVTTNQ